ncbi:Trypsin-1 [Eumeta japonica]|uniref:Trypsin-1 n=1 Tax=Eumeta variegata TaxID=151549 RepID=A0A4C1TKD5_EUMVA|nr:Trypsin-1 [Eumeta japonica]
MPEESYLAPASGANQKTNLFGLTRNSERRKFGTVIGGGNEIKSATGSRTETGIKNGIRVETVSGAGITDECVIGIESRNSAITRIKSANEIEIGSHLVRGRPKLQRLIRVLFCTSGCRFCERCGLPTAASIWDLQWKNRFDGQLWVACCMFTNVAGERPTDYIPRLIVLSNNRSQRFLFDAIFGLEVPVFEEQSLEEDDDDNKVKNCSCECGSSNQENRIVGGMAAGPHRYPWVARIVYDGQFHCGASLLTKDYVLTAAHCVRKLKRSKIRIILGDHDQTTTTESSAIMRAVSAIIRHRSFDADSYNNDIALLKLRKPVTFSNIIKPVCLPPSGVDPAGKEGVVVGWGRTSEGGQLPAVVQEVRVPILSLAQCRGMKYRASRITNNMLCAGRALTDSCQGDSGGPLLLQDGDRYQIVGIVSWGVGCGRPGYPGVYTRVTRYLPWLRANLRDTCLCAK